MVHVVWGRRGLAVHRLALAAEKVLILILRVVYRLGPIVVPQISVVPLPTPFMGVRLRTAYRLDPVAITDHRAFPKLVRVRPVLMAKPGLAVVPNIYPALLQVPATLTVPSRAYTLITHRDRCKSHYPLHRLMLKLICRGASILHPARIGSDCALYVSNHYYVILFNIQQCYS